MARLAVLLLVTLVAWWALPEVQDILQQPLMANPVAPQRIRMEDIVMTSYRRDGAPAQRLHGKRARIDLKFENAEVDLPVLEILEGGSVDARITAREGRKTRLEGGATRYELEHEVEGETVDGKRLTGSLVHYLLKEEKIVCPRPATLRTTDTELSALILEMEPGFDRGTALEDVRIVRRGEPETPGGPPTRLEAQSQEARFDFGRRSHLLLGGAQARQQKMELTAQQILLEEETQRVKATGEAMAVDGDLEIRAEILAYDAKARVAEASGPRRPSAVQRRPGAADQTITAARLKGILGAQGNRHVVATGGVVFASGDGTTIRSREATAFHSDGRTHFQGDVMIESANGRATGDQAVYYRETRRAYLTGRAEAWEPGPGNTKKRHVTGERIQYHAETGSAVVLGGVQGTLREDRPATSGGGR